MKLIKGALLRRAVLASAASVSAAVLLTPSAAFAADDSFTVKTTDGCGTANFVDYGPGAAGGGNNDDYVVINDFCADGHGVQARVWMNGLYWGSGYNGNGLSGAAVIWDPFRTWGPNNVNAGDGIQLQVCLVDGPNDATGSKCRQIDRVSVDG
ncbi:MAG TPA: hypothetical protein VF755_19265 [Catenuloplanes sp.]|jgi:hypothetical protein